MTILPHGLHFPAAATEIALAIMGCGTVVGATVFVARTRRELQKARRQLEIQAWQLKQLI